MPADELDVERDAQRAAEEIVALLADEIGPRRPTSAAEERAATALAERLGSVGAQTRIQPFRGVSTFAWAQAVPLAAALLRPGPLGLVLGAAEAELRLQLLTRLV